jgi:hypothetical protein
MATLVDKVKDFIGERDTAKFWPVQHIYDACNAALMELWARTKHNKVVHTLQLHAANHRHVFPADSMIPDRIVGTENELPIITQADAEAYSTLWRQDSPAPPIALLRFDQESIGTYPYSLNSEYELDLYCVQYPPEIDANTLDVDCDDTLRDAVAAKAASILVEDTHPDLADVLNQESEVNLRRFQTLERNKVYSRDALRIQPTSKSQQRRRGSVELIRRLQ